jgi:site-specific recombinase XerD
MQGYGEKAKLPKDKQHFHTLRHTCGVDLYGATTDLRFVMHWLGHKQIQNTVIYTHLAAATIATQARAAFTKLPRF